MELEKEKAPVSVTLIHPGRIDTPYTEHAQSYLSQQPAAHRGMLYPPEAVAEAILFLAEHPKRDMFVGSEAKFAAVLGASAPRFTDKLMELLLFHSQRSSRPSRPREESGLHRGVRAARAWNARGLGALTQLLRQGDQASGPDARGPHWRGRCRGSDTRRSRVSLTAGLPPAIRLTRRTCRTCPRPSRGIRTYSSCPWEGGRASAGASPRRW